jgi:hypothetical protein
MNNPTHTKKTPHGDMYLLGVEAPPRWKGFFNSPAAVAAATRYVYVRPATAELVITDQRGTVTELRPNPDDLPG